MATEKHPGYQTAPELPADLAKEHGIDHRVSEIPVASSSSPANPSLDDDPKTDAAVDDILAKESDAVLAAEDAARAVDEPVKKHHGFWGSIGHFFAAWARSPKARWATMLVILAAVGAVAAIPEARYYALNSAGVRSSVNVKVVDDTTQLPLKNVKVTVGGHAAMTDVKGVAKVSGLRLGPQQLSIERLAFAPVTRSITVGWGSNPLGKVTLRATGFQYVIQVNDYLSGKPLEGAQAESGDLNAVSDKQGKITLTVSDTKGLPVTVSASGYRTESLTLATTNLLTNSVVLVPSGKAVFISKQSGKFDLVAMDIDGRDRKLILAGTGSENYNLSLAVNPAGTLAALVSTRDNLRSKDGYLLSAITLVDIKEGTKLTIEHAEQVKLIDWVGDRIIYQVTTAGPSGPVGTRSRLVSYSYSTSSRIQLAAEDQFNMVASVGGSIYYAPSGTDPNAKSGLFRIKPDGGSKTSIFDKEVWTGLRSTYDQFSLQTPDGWYTYEFDNQTPQKSLDPPPAAGRLYVESRQGGKSLWVDNRDGKGMLFVRSGANGTDKVIATGEGLTYPVRWLNDNVVIYRQSNNTNIADYAVSLLGGAPKKISDVTNTYGLSQGY